MSGLPVTGLSQLPALPGLRTVEFKVLYEALCDALAARKGATASAGMGQESGVSWCVHIPPNCPSPQRAAFVQPQLPSTSPCIPIATNDSSEHQTLVTRTPTRYKPLLCPALAPAPPPHSPAPPQEHGRNEGDRICNAKWARDVTNRDLRSSYSRTIYTPC